MTRIWRSTCSQSSLAMDEAHLSKSTTENFEQTGIEPTGLEGDKSLKAGLNFYPSSSTAVINDEFKEDKDALKPEYHKQYGPDLIAVATNVADVDSNDLTPEQNIALFALRMAIIEKSATGIGALSFIWASTIILGGFASNINPVDFLVVAIILATEGTRIFSRSRELEWQHLVAPNPKNRSLTTFEINKSSGYVEASYKSQRTSTSDNVREKHPTPQPPVTVRIDRARGQTASVRLDANNLKKSLHRMYSIRAPNLPIDSGDNLKNEIAKKLQTTVQDMKAKKWSSRLRRVFKSASLRWMLPARGMSAILYWTQMTSAIICLILSGWRLCEQKFNPPNVGDEDTPVNLFTSLNIFYSLALTEAMLFLLERGYWEYKINYEQLMVKVSNKAELGDANQEMMKQFFYEVFKKRIEGSVFGGVDMDLIDYSLLLLESGDSYEQLRGATALRKITERYDDLSADALRRLGAAPGVIERLVDMLSWRSYHEEDLRREVAALICPLARQSKNCFRIAGVPGSMEGIVSLLVRHDKDYLSFDQLWDPSTNIIPLRLDGLRILVALAREHGNLLKIGETRGLVPILVAFIAVKDVDRLKSMEGPEFKIFKKALRLLTLLAAARDNSGNILRHVIARVVSGIANMRDILEFGDALPQLQWMVIEILTNLALDDDIRRAIGSTGGVIRKLFTLCVKNLDGSGARFSTEHNRTQEKAVSRRAGDALNLLSIRNERNCFRMMDLQDHNGKKLFIHALVDLLNEHREQTICSAKVLRSLMEYASDSQKQEIALCTSRVMSLVMTSTSQKMQEAVVGLAPRVIAVINKTTYDQIFDNIDRPQLIQKLLRNLEPASQVSMKFPRIRRHSIELILALTRRDVIFFEAFMKDGMLEDRFVQTLDTICEEENFVIFAAAEGLTRHSITMEDLVQNSIAELLTLIPQAQERQ